MAEPAHSTWGASKLEQVMLCPGSHVMQRGAPDRASEYAAEGTVAHLVLTWALQQRKPASAFLGRVVHVDRQGRVCEAVRRHWSFDVDDDMVAHVQTCIDYVTDIAGEHGVVLVDRKVNYANFLEVPEGEAWGTLDVAVLLPDELVVVDLKYGRGVAVDAGEDFDCKEVADATEIRRPNPQLAAYGLGALNEFGPLGDFQRVRLVILQPRLTTRPSEYDMTVPELEAWGLSVARSAVNSARNALQLRDVHCSPSASRHERGGWERTFLRPGDKQCKFCKAKAVCPALRADVTDTVLAHVPATPDEFMDAVVPGAAHIEATDAQWLSAAMLKADRIEDWLKAVRAETERRLLASQEVPEFKLVNGREGARRWSDPEQAEAYLKDTVRLSTDDLYDKKVKSPTQIAKLGPPLDKDGKPKPVKEGQPAPTIGPRQWAKVAQMIVRSPPAKHVAHVSDPRPPVTVTPVADDFEPVTVDASDLA